MEERSGAGRSAECEGRRCSSGRRLVLGLCVLVVVDVIWVASAVLSEKLFKEETYPKPFFSVYFKTSLFTLCLFPFLFWRPWHLLCCPPHPSLSPNHGPHPSLISNSGPPPPLSPNRRPHPSLSPNSRSHSQALPKRSCLKRTPGMSVGGSSPPPAPTAVVPTLPHPRLATGSIQDSMQCAVDVSKAVNAETGQEEVSPGLLTEASTVATATAQPDQSVQPSQPMGAWRGGGVTISEPKFDQLVGEDEGQSVPSRSSSVTFSPVIEVRHRKSWNDIKLALQQHPAHSQCLLPLTVRQTCVLSLIFGIMWFFANYFYQLAFLVTSVGVVNTLSSLSGVFVLVLSALPVFSLSHSDRLTLTKVIVVSVSVGGAALVGMSQFSGSGTLGNLGLSLLYSSLGALLYACYLTLLKKRVGDTERLEVPMFFGFVGLFNVVVMMPVVVVWHWSSLETFEWPPNSTVWTLLLVNGLVGTVLSELLWLIGSFLTSPLIGTLSLALVAPLSITYDIVFEHTDFSVQFFCGAVLLVVAFVGVAVLEAYGGWDPAWRVVTLLGKWLWIQCCRKKDGELSETAQLLGGEQEEVEREHMD